MADVLLPYLIVRVAAHLCALPVAQVNEVLRVPALEAGGSNVPGLLGVTLLRGQPTAVLDLAVLLGLRQQASEIGPGMRLVSTRLEHDGTEQVIGLMVEEVVGLRALDPTTFEMIALPGGRERAVGPFDRGFVSLVDACGVVPAEALQVRAGEPA